MWHFTNAMVLKLSSQYKLSFEMCVEDLFDIVHEKFYRVNVNSFAEIV